MKADLHMHSRVSDGSDTIEEIIAVAQKKGLDVIAISEHDTTAHFAQIPSDTGSLTVLPAVELSTWDAHTGLRAHILAYQLKDPQLIEDYTLSLLRARNDNSERQLRILQEAGYSIDESKLARADGKYLYKQHIMEWLVKTGQAEEMFGGFYKHIFKGGGICDFDIDYLDPVQAVERVVQAGGLAVLAHPGKQHNYELIPTLADAGLKGLEINHHSHDEKDREIIADYAQRYGLFLTGGSDYHGDYEPQPFGIGDFLSPECGAKAILSHC